MITHRSFSAMFTATHAAMLSHSHEVHTERWQGTDVSKRPDMKSHELLNWNCNLSLDWLTQLYGGRGLWGWGDDRTVLGELRRIIEPNHPWADDHFLERVGGEPLNPGVQWANWPWASSADKHRKDQQFNHTYMQRLWPKWAGMTPGGEMPWGREGTLLGEPRPHGRKFPSDPSYFMDGPKEEVRRGIAFEYGDLWDLVELLAKEPDTRQAWIPLFFPEDTGVGDGGRKPCTLGYQLIMRGKSLSMYYPLRSCDLIRHFRDDIYLAIRLLLWVLDRCIELNPKAWEDVTPGYYAMHCTSLHVFENDFLKMQHASSK